MRGTRLSIRSSRSPERRTNRAADIRGPSLGGQEWCGLLPIMWSHGTGAEVMQRIAVPMVGGMVSSTLLTLIVIPAIYAGVKGRASIASPGASGHCRHERVSATATESCNGRTVRRARTFVPAATALALAGQGLTSARSCPGRPARRPTCASGSRGRRGRVRSKGRRAWRRK